uniref:Acyl-CoA-binding domain-containing protein 6 n=1 Tax=Nyssomyia neivai TaxID=330878 RepID=A0A1L8DZ93_9DIPT
MSDLEFSDEEGQELEKKFNEATKFVAGNVTKFNDGQLLTLYGWYKQSTVGDCDGNRPGIFQMAKRAKWDAWNKVKSTPKDEAMEKYIEIVRSACPEEDLSAVSVKASANSWVSVSTHRQEDDIREEDKTIFDHVQEKNFERFLEALENCTNVNDLDENSLTLAHWAADRGQDAMLSELLKRAEININVLDEDGQTPLHYAAFCGHPKCAKILLDAGADVTIKDSQGSTCLDVACDDAIRILLTK